MKILVTGGMGFVGSHLVDVLIRRGHEVRVFDNLEFQVHCGKRPTYINKGAQYIIGDMRNLSQLEKSVKGIEIIFHQAALVGVGQSMYKVAKYIQSNTYGTANILNILTNVKHKVRKFIVASSMSIYGEGAYYCTKCKEVSIMFRSEKQLKVGDWQIYCPHCSKAVRPMPTQENKPLMPTSVYALSKRHQEELCLLIGQTYRIPTVALRYFNIYGPRQALSNPYTGVCAIFLSRIKNDHSPLIYEDGLQSRDFIHVNDIVQANLLVMSSGKADYKVFNVGSGKPVTILEVAKTISGLCGKDINPEIVNKYRSGDIRHCFADISKIKSLGFSPRVSFNAGMRNLAEWSKAESAKDRAESANIELQKRGLISA